jgi:hypothetical protein
MSVPLETPPWYERYWLPGLIALGVIGVGLLAFYNPTR